MSTVKATYIQHPSASSPNFTLASDGTVSGGAGLGGLVHLHTESFSGQATINIDNVFTADYDQYQMVGYLSSNTGTVGNVSIRMRSAGSTVSTNSYYFNGTELQSSSATSVSVARSNGLAGGFILGPINTMPASFNTTLYAPFLSAITEYNSLSIDSYGTDMLFRAMGGRMNTSASYDGVSLYVGSGTITGTIRVYGYAND